MGMLDGLGQIIGAGIQAGGTAFDTIYSANSVKGANREGFNNSKLSWLAQNAYNTPLAQRKRMEAAGFNPNLVYGNGSVANTASAPSTPDVKAPPPSVAGDALGKYAAVRLSDAQTDVTQKQLEEQDARIANTKLDSLFKESQIQNTDASTLNTLQNTASSKSQLAQAQRLYDNQATALELSNRAQEIANARGNIENSNLDNLQKMQVKNAQQDLLLKKSQMNETDYRAEYQKEMNRLQKLGIYPTAGLFGNLVPKAPGILKSIGDEVKSWGSIPKDKSGRPLTTMRKVYNSVTGSVKSKRSYKFNTKSSHYE